MTPKEKEKVAKLMKNLDLTEAEAIELMEADKQIDKGAKLFELTAEQEKASKTAKSKASPRLILRHPLIPQESQSDNPRPSNNGSYLLVSAR